MYWSIKLELCNNVKNNNKNTASLDISPGLVILRHKTSFDTSLLYKHSKQVWEVSHLQYMSLSIFFHVYAELLTEINHSVFLPKWNKLASYLNAHPTTKQTFPDNKIQCDGLTVSAKVSCTRFHFTKPFWTCHLNFETCSNPLRIWNRNNFYILY